MRKTFNALRDGVDDNDANDKQAIVLLLISCASLLYSVCCGCRCCCFCVCATAEGCAKLLKLGRKVGWSDLGAYARPRLSDSARMRKISTH